MSTNLPYAERRRRVLAIATHPVQYAAPQFRRMAASPALDFQVAYCDLRGATPSFDPDFGTTVAWDIPLLDGYAWTSLTGQSSNESFGEPVGRGLSKLIRRGNFHAILCYVSYLQREFWSAYFAARLSGAAFLFGTDAAKLAPRDGRSWKVAVKQLVWPRLFGLADQVIVPSSATRDLMCSLGIPKERITLTPYSVDNDWWTERSRSIDRDAVRASWGASDQEVVILFCAKLQPWKRPGDLLRAFADCNIPNARLIFAGDGPLRADLESQASSLNVRGKVRFLGFVNQSSLPAVYKGADVMVLPSEYEPFAVVVNEAMCCGCPVIASDQVGAARDLVQPVYPPFVFPCGDINRLTATLRTAVADRYTLQDLREKCVTHMQTWSFDQNVPATIEALEQAISGKPLGRTKHRDAARI
jgi:glycosyltransferase involved in cell wall biosynthesis